MSDTTVTKHKWALESRSMHKVNLRRMNSSIARPVRGLGRTLLLGLALLSLCAAARAELADQECLKCHGQAWLGQMRPEALAAMVRAPQGEAPVLRSPDAVKRLHVSPDHFKTSVHAGIHCTDCHSGIEKLPHNQRLAKLSCTDCHSEAEKALATSVHKPQAGKATPGCLDCHGSAHEIDAVKSARTFSAAEKMVQNCSKCHDKGSAETKGVMAANPVASYRDNVHGKALFVKGLGGAATCGDCHGSHAILPPSDPRSQVNAKQAPQTCGQCHQGVASTYASSIHGQKLAEGKHGASCTDCHNSHGIGPVNEAFLLGMVQECSHCHEKLGATYLKSYHGKATSLGSGSAAVCSSCHGAHDILPTSSTLSRVNPANLQATCGSCHDNANKNFVKYMPHNDFKDPKSSLPVFIIWIAMNSILLGTLSVFIPHGILWFQRTLLERFHTPNGYHLRPAHERRITRFHPVHRFTHALIIISFMGLVATGFPLKYSYTGWAKAIAAVMGGTHAMGVIHRILAVVTFLYAGVHAAFLVYFFWKKCPRPIYKFIFGPDSLVFNLRDLKDFIAMMRWFLWLGPRPKLDRWVYFEKFDYWGEVWGVFVIGGTGLILWMPTLFTRWLPGWVLNCATVIHSIEALLAASVIFLVHFFNTHMRPEKFPIDMVMLTGQMSESEMKEERPAEYERLVAEGKLEERIAPPVAFHWRLIGAIIGLGLFVFGIVLIALALTTEIGQFFH